MFMAENGRPATSCVSHFLRSKVAFREQLCASIKPISYCLGLGCLGLGVLFLISELTVVHDF